MNFFEQHVPDGVWGVTNKYHHMLFKNFGDEAWEEQDITAYNNYELQTLTGENPADQ